MVTLLDHVETYQALIEQADSAHAEGDLAQAVAKAWEAASYALGTIAERRDWKFDTPADMLTAMDRLSEETNRPDIDLLFEVAFIAPYNFEEGWIDAEGVEYDLQAVRKLLAMIEDIE